MECKYCGKSYKTEHLKVTAFGINKKLDIPDCECEKLKIQEGLKQEKINSLLKQSDMPAKYIGENLCGWINVPGTEKMITYANRFIEDINEKVENGILFAGKPGRGKTKVSCYIGNEIIKRYLLPVKYVSITKYLHTVSKIWEKDDFIQKYTNCKILIIDDIGESKMADWQLGYLYELLDGRNQPAKINIINCMRTIKELDDMIQPHNVSRLLEMAGPNIAEVTSDKDMRYYKNNEKK